MEFLNNTGFLIRLRIKAGYAAIVLAGFWVASCSTDAEQVAPIDGCVDITGRAVSMEALRARYRGEPLYLEADEFLEAFVVSSDREGNIFGSLYVQDRLAGPALGLELKTDLIDTEAMYPPGTRVRIRLKDLYLGKQQDGYALGTRGDVFGNIVLDRLPARTTQERLAIACGPGGEPEPMVLRAESLDTTQLHTLVRLEDVEVASGYTGVRFAEDGAETTIPLAGCSGVRLAMENSGYSNFADRELPAGSGSVTGILSGNAGAYRIRIRYADDLLFTEPGCGEKYPPEKSDQLFITEIADPDNEPGARFIELFNAGAEALDLKGWSLVRYTNANTTPGKAAELEGLRIEPGAALVFSASPEVFETIYGFPPDGVFPSNGPADSNGDDSMVLVDPFGEVADSYGIPGEDGSGTASEFEDGGAFRNPGVSRGNPVFTASEWSVYNDSGGSGTQKQVLNAPEDFSPGTHGPNE